MKRRTLALAIVLGCLALPALAVLVSGAAHYFATRATGTMTVAGKERYWIVHVPPGYDRARPTPLVISMHGAMNWPAFQMESSEWNRVADAHGFIVVYPSGEGGGPRIWQMRGAARDPAHMPDVVFISALIDKLSAAYNIDPARIFANGLSNGGGMSFALSCALSGRIAAIGAVSAAETLSWEWCDNAQPMPMIAFHGTGDRWTPYHGGKVWLAPDPFPDIPGWATRWAARNRCAASAESPVAADVTKREYSGCAGDASVVLYTVQDGGHTWPGGLELPEWMLGKTTRSIDASETMWAFFAAHPKR